MLIDWFTVGAQALNFVVLVWLMRHFLYKPILHAIDAREKLIAAELADAAAKKAEAHEERDEFEHKNEELDQQRAGLLKKATDDANAERERLMSEARTAANALSAKRQDTLRADAKNLDQAIQRRTQQEVFAIARKALTDLATASLEERIVAVFTRRLRELDGPTKSSLASALKASSDAGLVRSAFELPAEQRAVLQNAVNETFSADVHLRFETAPDLVGGIELVTNGQKIGWTIAEYLKSLEEGVAELLKKKVEAEVKPETPKPEPAKAEPNGTTTSKANGAAKAEAERASPNAEAKPTDPETKAEPEPKAAAKPTESEPKTKAEPKPEPKAEAKPPEPEPKPKTEPKPEPKAKAKSPEPEAPADSKLVVQAAPKSKPEVTAARPEVNAPAKPEANAAAKPEAPRSQAKSQ